VCVGVFFFSCGMSVAVSTVRMFGRVLVLFVLMWMILVWVCGFCRSFVSSMPRGLMSVMYWI